MQYNAKQCAKLHCSRLRNTYVVSLTQIKILKGYLELLSRSVAFRRDDSLTFRKRDLCVQYSMYIYNSMDRSHRARARGILSDLITSMQYASFDSWRLPCEGSPPPFIKRR